MTLEQAQALLKEEADRIWRLCDAEKVVRDHAVRKVKEEGFTEKVGAVTAEEAPAYGLEVRIVHGVRWMRPEDLKTMDAAIRGE